MIAQANSDYVLAATVARRPQAADRAVHMLPNSLAPVLVQATLTLATAIIEAAALSFLGLGNPDPAAPEWGVMLADAQGYLDIAAGPGDLPGDRRSSSPRSASPCSARRCARPSTPSCGSEAAMALLEVTTCPSTSPARASGRSARSTGSRSRSTPARWSAWSASPAAARASPRWPSWACCPAQGVQVGGKADLRRHEPARGSTSARCGTSAAATSR